MIDSDFKEVEWPADVKDSDVIEFLKLLCTFSVDINTKDPQTKDWIFRHKEWIKSGKE